MNDSNLLNKIVENQLEEPITNLGLFREYIKQYLRTHPKVNKNMTFLVRSLEPSSNGLPIQIYIFCNDQVWSNYENIQSLIFDHLLAIIPQFNLSIFQSPSGKDIHQIKS